MTHRQSQGPVAWEPQQGFNHGMRPVGPSGGSANGTDYGGVGYGAESENAKQICGFGDGLRAVASEPVRLACIMVLTSSRKRLKCRVFAYNAIAIILIPVLSSKSGSLLFTADSTSGRQNG